MGYGALSPTSQYANVIVTLEAMIGLVGIAVVARHLYSAREIRFNHRFVDIFLQTARGHRYIDYRDFDGIVPCP